MSTRRHFAIFTTASLPWMTGTAINPLFRAAYLAKNGDKDVTLVIPWLCLRDQELVYPNNIVFDWPLEHESYVRHWIEERIDFRPSFSIKFYPGKFSKEMRSILPVGDITECIPDEVADIAVLEEPEHLNWYHHGRRWKNKFRRVIGIVHTNYLAYVRREKNGQVIACFLKCANTWVTRIYCHKIIRLSGATQDLPRSVICNVHGVNPKFLEVGKLKLRQLQNGEKAFTKGAYYIGKMVWSKGYRELLDLLSKYQSKLVGLEVDLYGSGEDSDEVCESAKRLSLSVNVHPGRDHADPLFHEYKVFINPSTTDVVCTTTAEALAMGKIVICANHPSNEFFKQFPNCRIYDNEDEFVQLTLNALSEQPAPLTDAQRYWSTLARDVPFAGLMVTFYEAMKEVTEYGKTKYLPHSDLDISNSFEGLVLGGLAGGCSAYLTTPLDVIKTRLQVQGSTSKYNGWLDAITKTWASEGVRGLFKGSVPRIIWYIPASAFTFMAVEFLRDHFNDKVDADAHELTSLSIDTRSEVEKSA